MLTPEISLEIGKFSAVTSRAQPPAWMRFGAMLNEDQNIGIPPTSVGGGLPKEGNWLARAGFCGPGSLSAAGVALRAPSGGRSGLPKEAGRDESASASLLPMVVLSSFGAAARDRLGWRSTQDWRRRLAPARPE
jgi:hypothetical protein